MGVKKTLGIIPARAGSKGIPGKNIKPLDGKPLIAYTIEAALQSTIDKTIVSTEDPKIAEIASRYGAEVPFLRPLHLATDEASSLSVLFHALQYMEKEENYCSDVVVFLQPTSPFRNSEHINQAIKMLMEGEVDSVIGVREVGGYHPYWMFTMDRDNTLKPFLQIENRPLRRQDVPKIYVTNASITVTKREYFDKSKNPPPDFAPRLKGLVMDAISSFDINEPLDFLIAEAILQQQKEGRKI